MKPLATRCIPFLLLLPGYLFAEEGGRVIEEILVTAEKREASVQETSIAITAYSHEELELRGIEGIEGLQFSAPNLVISHNSQSPVTYAYIRGIGSDQLVAGFDPGVAYHFDGVYVGQPSSMPVDMWDMERVEVLRGPQGTLYGRNTTGGAINVISKNPTDELDGTVDATLGNYDRVRLRGALGGPIAQDRLNGRLAFIYDKADGYQDNGIGEDADAIDHWALRGKLDFKITDTLSLLLTAQQFENEGNQGQKKRESFEGFPVYTGALPNPSDPRKVDKDHEEKLDLENTFLSAKLDWDLGSVRFVSITSYIENDWFQTTDIDMSSNALMHQDWDMSTEQFTQEFQLVSNGDGPLEWIVGAFYFDEDLSTDYFFEDVNVFTFFNGGTLDTTSFAVYGQASYDFSDSGLPIRLTAGVRYTDDEKKIDEYQQIPAFLVDLAAQDELSWDEWTGKLGIDWFISEDVLGYFTYSHGYKGGGFSMGQFDSYLPEFVDSYEVGLKTTFMEGRAQVNTAAFYYDYEDLQVNFLNFTSFITNNAAEATIGGVEVESTFLVTDNLMLGGSFTWLDAEYDEYIFSEGPPVIDLSGERLNRAPEYTVALTAQYDFQLGRNGVLTARTDYYWQDEVYYRPQNIQRHRADDFYNWDARLVWTTADARFTVDAFIRNITDEDALRSITISDGLSTGNNTFDSYYPPRTYGLRVGWNFGG
ncbi:MAG: TonB-dependent receptor [Pseudomonadales bacterium]